MTTGEVEIGLPARLERRRSADGMQIVRSWGGMQALFVTAFAIFWDGFMVVWYSAAITRHDTEAMLFGLIHAGVGVGMTYYAVATWFNKTIVTFSKKKVSVTHEPLPHVCMT